MIERSFELQSWHPGKFPADKLKGQIRITDTCVEIYLDGYGVSGAEPGSGGVILLEVNPAKEPVVHVWSDIQQPDPAVSISLKDALEARRSPCEFS